MQEYSICNKVLKQNLTPNLISHLTRDTSKFGKDASSSGRAQNELEKNNSFLGSKTFKFTLCSLIIRQCEMCI